MKMRKHPIIVRSVRSEFVRISGLKHTERDKLAERIRKLRRSDPGVSIVIQYGLHGWLEVRESGIYRCLYEKREKITSALRVSIVKVINSVFPQKC
jgi:hypothetical protein